MRTFSKLLIITSLLACSGLCWRKVVLVLPAADILSGHCNDIDQRRVYAPNGTDRYLT